MIFVARVASFAIATLSLAGLISVSTPVHAADVVQPTTPVVQLVKSLAQAEVPAFPTTSATPTTVQAPSSAPAVNADSEEEFASLDDAVAAQDRAVADEATRCLAGAIYFESKGEPLSGQLAVAQVIINRAKSGRFPADVCGVVKQRGQFGFVRGGRIPSIDEARSAYRTAVAVARVALADAWDSAAETALYFNTPGRAPGARLQRVAMIGNHIFYR
jgi:spore germination cell wall hydrolase CwlJ-like protein